ncbi:prostaglandin D2 synthase a [Scyliorhinus canicula]|uniref:prostaglandin D2 synthase a n=1 Tax=Scyliorhinus canicula TaxID=7830 RepID=UPI0018F50388|nr:prostaglandin D2 synthase a [Scyliorhinus canicula]
MNKVVLCATLALLCTVLESAEIQVQSNFDLNQFLGKWYIIGMASDARWFTSRRHKFTMSTILMKPVENDKVETILTKVRRGKCLQIILPYRMTEQDGQFEFHSDRWKSDNDVYVAETNYDEYALIHNIITTGPEVRTLVKLYGRGKELRPDILERFRQYCLTHGLEEENIVTFPKRNECRPTPA